MAGAARDTMTGLAEGGPERRGDIFSPFRGAFCRVWLLRACSTLGGQILAFALTLQLYQVSSSALDLGLLGLIQFFPSLLLALPAGHLVDRFAPGRIATIVQLSNALAAMLLFVPGLPASAVVAMLFTVALMTGASRAFEHPINTALLPSVVPADHVAAAIAWTTSVAKTGTLVGPIMGGALYAFNPAIAYGTALALFLPAAGIAWSLRAFGAAGVAQPFGLKSVFAGAGVIWQDRVLGGAMVLDLLAVLFGGATALLPIYALDVLHTDSVGLGILRAAPGVGAVAIGLWLARRPVRKNAGYILLASTALFGLATCGFGLSKSYGLSLVMLCAIGATDMVSIHIRSALIQLRTPAHLRGRVGAINGIFISSSNQIGAFESGLTAYWFGTVPAVVLGGVATVAVTGAIASRFRELRLIGK